jgi:hypothetical protein
MQCLEDTETRELNTKELLCKRNRAVINDDPTYNPLCTVTDRHTKRKFVADRTTTSREQLNRGQMLVRLRPFSMSQLNFRDAALETPLYCLELMNKAQKNVQNILARTPSTTFSNANTVATRP